MKQELILNDKQHQCTIGIERYNAGFSILTVSTNTWPTYHPKKNQIMITNRELNDLVALLKANQKPYGE